MSDVSKANDLIEDARAAMDYRDDTGWFWVGRLADALEAATRVPVRGETNDDREALAKEVLDLAVKTRDKADRWANTLGEIALGDEAYGEAELLRQASVALSRASVPDTTLCIHDRMEQLQNHVDEIREEEMP